MTQSTHKQFIYCSTYDWYNKPVRKNEDEELYRRISIQVQDKGLPVYGFDEQGCLNTRSKTFIHFRSDIGWLGVNARFSPNVSMKDLTKVDDKSFDKKLEAGHVVFVFKTDEHYFKQVVRDNFSHTIEDGYLYLSGANAGKDEMIPLNRIVAVIGGRSRDKEDYLHAKQLCDSIEKELNQ